MTRKKNSMLKLTASIAMALIMSVSVVLPALAVPYSEGTDSDNQAKAAITKVLKMPIGTITPDVAFKFVFESISADGKDYDENNPNMPSIKEIEIEFDEDEEGDTDGGVKTVTIESGNIMDSLDGPWPHPGEYKYTVTEETGTYNIIDKKKEWMIYSKALYELVIIVDKDEKGLFVRYIVATRTITDDGDELEKGEKVNPTPGGDEDYEYSYMKFTNIYSKTNGGGDVDPETTVLEISKTVTGYGAREDIYFDFEVTVSAPEIGESAEKYKAYVVGSNGVILTSLTENNTGGVATASDTGGRAYFLLTPEVKATISLKHGERLVFVDMEVGSSFTVNEKGAEGYIAGYEITLDGVGPEELSNTTTNTDLAAPEDGIAYIGEEENTVDYTNRRDLTTPTGISVDNLPYFVMIAAAMSGLVLFVAAKSRRKKRERA